MVVARRCSIPVARTGRGRRSQNWSAGAIGPFPGRGREGHRRCGYWPNSAPPPRAVSAASAGSGGLRHPADQQSPPFAEEGPDIRCCGAGAAEAPRGLTDGDGNPVQSLDLADVADDDYDGRPTVLVLGSEGHGLRSLVARLLLALFAFRASLVIMRLMTTPIKVDLGVDSLNVGVPVASCFGIWCVGWTADSPLFSNILPRMYTF